jgi:hypothetical protein
MSTSQNIIHSNSMFADIKQRISELEALVTELQEEIRILKDSYERIYDL